MRKEFFGIDVPEALHKASKRLGIPVAELDYRQLPQRFGQPLHPEKVGVLIEYHPQQAKPKPTSHEWNEEVERLRDQPQRFAALVLERLLEGLGYPAAVKVTEKGEQVLLTAAFEDAVPDTRRGDMRELRGALQYLINRVVASRGEEQRRFIVDFTGDIEDRTAKMKLLGEELAAKAGRIGQPLQVGLMDSQDRRLLHLALVDRSDVSTYSHGGGAYRVLCVEPGKKD
jgi:spoIIIJ-associated protein